MSISLVQTIRHTPPLSPTNVEGSPSVVITLSRTVPGVQSVSGAVALLEWVKGFDDKRNVHVVLGGVKQRDLQRELQAMGCTVTRKTN